MTSNLQLTLELKASIDQFTAGVTKAGAAFSGALAGMTGAAEKTGSQVEQAMGKIGLRRHAEIEAEIKKVEDAYRTLAASGELSGRELAQAQMRMTERVRELRSETNGWTQSLGKMKAELAAAGAAMYGITRVLASAAGESKRFATSMAEVSTLLDDTSSMDQLTESVRAMSREFGGDATVQAKALYQIISAGASDAAVATELLTAANKLAVGGVTDVATAADGLTSILNAYGKDAQEATSVSDALFVAMKAGKTTIGELSASIGQVAPMASQAGVSIEELLGSVAALTKGGVATTEAMTQVRAILTAVVKGGKEASDTAEQIGLEFNTAAIRSKGFAAWLQEVKEKAGGNEQVLTQLFGRVEAINGIFALTGNAAKDFAGILDSMGDKAGATEGAFAKMEKALAAERFGAAIRDVQRALGDAVLMFTPLLEAVTWAINAFNELPGPVRTSVAALGFAGAAAVPLTLALASISRALTILRTGWVISTAATTANTAAATANAVAQVANAGAVAKTAASVRALSLAMKAVPPLLALTVVAFGDEAAAESLASYSQAAEDLADTEKRVADEARAARSAAVERANQLMQYRDTVILTAEQVAALGEAEREQYRESLEGKRELQRMLLRIALQEELLGQNTKAAQAELSAGFAKIREGFAALEGGATTAAAAIRSGISPAAQALVADFQALTAEGMESSEALRALFEGVAAGDFAGVSGRVQALNQMVADGAIKAVEMREAWAQWIAGLHPEEIDVALTTMRAGFVGVEGGAEALADVIRGPLSAALGRLGIDAGTAFDGISTANRQAITDIDLLASHLDAAGITGQAAGKIIAEALGKAVPKTESLAALNAFEQRIEALRRAGKITSDQFTTLRATIDAQRAALDGSGTAAEGAAKALDDLKASIAGATDKKQLQQFETAAREAFAAGKISAEQLAAVLALIQQQLQQLGDAPKPAITEFERLRDAIAGATSTQELDSLKTAIEAAFKAGTLAASEYAALLKQIEGQHQGLSKQMISLTHVVRNRYAEMSDAAAAYFDQQMKGVRSIKDWWTVLSDRRFEAAKAQFASMADAAQGFVEQLSSGEDASYALARAQAFLDEQTGRAAASALALGDEQLEPLRAAIADAQRRMASLNDAAQDTLTSLQDDLLRLQGREDELARRRQERRRAEIEAQLAEAKAAGNRDAAADLQEALRVLEQIGREEDKQRRAREQESASRERPTREGADEPRRSTREGADEPRRSTCGCMAPERRVRIDLACGGRQATVWADDESGLIDLLQHAKLTAN